MNPEIGLNVFLSSDILYSMKTTIDIPDIALAKLLALTKAQTKREAILCAVSEFNRRHTVAELVASFGTWDMDANDTIESADMAETGEQP